MRILNREQFLKMPAYTFYQYTERLFGWQELEVLTGTFGNGNYPDWIYLLLADVNDDGFDDYMDAEMHLVNGGSLPLDLDCTRRAGRYPADMKQEFFKIFELEDLIQFRDLLNMAIDAASPASVSSPQAENTPIAACRSNLVGEQSDG